MRLEEQLAAYPELAGSGTAAEYGQAYLDWKGWRPENFGHLVRREEADLSALLKKAKLNVPAGSRVLEIGFGNGTFLAFGTRRGWKMHGTEVNPILLERAAQKGFEVTRTGTLALFPERGFDVVAAFDVMEHIPPDQLAGFLLEVRRVLKEDGVFLAKFPNGDSPFGRPVQHGDLTHRSAIGSRAASFLAMQAELEIVYLGNEVLAVWTGAPHFLYRMVSVPARKLIDLGLNFVYGLSSPLAFSAPNMAMVLRKPKRIPGTI